MNYLKPYKCQFNLIPLHVVDCRQVVTTKRERKAHEGGLSNKLSTMNTEEVFLVAVFCVDMIFTKQLVFAKNKKEWKKRFQFFYPKDAVTKIGLQILNLETMYIYSFPHAMHLLYM